MDGKLPESLEKQIFFDLLSRHVNAVDSGNVRVELANRYGISLEAIQAIERKGLARDWPPLD